MVLEKQWKWGLGTPKFMEHANFGDTWLTEPSGFVHAVACLFEPSSRAVWKQAWVPMIEMTVACKLGNWVKGEKDFNYYT